MIMLRRATIDDAAFLFRLRNDPDVVKVCLSQKPVESTEHMRWLMDVLEHKDRWQLYIAERLGPIGQGRLEKIGPFHAEVSYSMTAEHRGHGLGKELLGALCAEAARLGYRTVQARVRLDNAASVRALMSEGFNFSPLSLMLEKTL